MKKLISLLLSLCLIFGLSGCGAKEEAVEEAAKEKTFQKTGFSITLPSGAEDTSVNETAEVTPFVLTVDGITVSAQEEYQSNYGYEMTAEEYANALIDAKGFDSTVELKSGIPSFTYEKAAEGMTYLCITQVTDTSFWLISAACASDVYPDNYDTMWKYLTSAKTYANEAAYMNGSLQTVSVEDLTMDLPAGAKDVTAQWETGATFTYSISDENALMGIREEKASIDAYIESLEHYCSSLIEENELDCEVSTRDGIPYFTFTSDDGALTHLVTVYEGTDSYWYLQSYTETNLFSMLEDGIWAYLETVQIT